MSSGKVVLGVLAGVAVGAIMGILFAPEKGSKTRKQILEKGEDYADELKAKFDELFETLTEKFGGTREAAEELASKGKAKYDEAKREGKHIASEVKHAVS